ncbi:MAG: hypothetical protein ACRDLR_01375 [Gaiellaceae bacterium]
MTAPDTIDAIEIADAGSTIAWIFRSAYQPQTTQFITPPQTSFQAGYIVYPAGGAVAPHRHRPVVRTLETTSEALFVKSGRAVADFFSSEGRLLESHEVKSGDFLLLVAGGHAFRMKEDTVFIEVKQGPYFGADEKDPL